jgi:hypothetical protein
VAGIPDSGHFKKILPFQITGLQYASGMMMVAIQEGLESLRRFVALQVLHLLNLCHPLAVR